MRNFLMITTAVYGLSVFAPAISQAQTCTVAPSCADMGYDKTAADCEGKKMLKCPFDLKAVSCEDGDSGDVLNLFDLAWEEARPIYVDESDYFVDKEYDYNGSDYNGSEFTFPEDGCILDFGTYDNSRINGIELQIYVLEETLLCLKKGSTFWRSSFNNSYGNKAGLSFIPAKSAKKPLSECEDGDFYYANDRCSSKIVGGTLIGVVIDAENKLVLGWGADTLNSPWHTTNTDTSLTNYTTVETAITDMDGRGNSNTLHNAGSSTKATECIELNKANKHWFLPSAGQLNNILNKYDVIQPKLYEYYALDYDHNVSTIMTSTEYDSKYVWMLNLSSKTFENTRKSSYDKTLCVFEYGDE